MPDPFASASPGHVLVVPAHAWLGLRWAAALAAAGHRVVVAQGSSPEALARAEDPEVEAALVETGVAGGSLAWHRRLVERVRPCASVIAGDGRPPTVRRLVAAGVTEVVDRGDPSPVVVAAVARAAAATRRLRAAVVSAVPFDEGEVRGSERCRDAVGRAVRAVAAHGGLSARERSVLHYVVLGYPYAAIGQRLSIAPRTVKMHAANVRRKLGTPNRDALLREVFER